MCKQTPIPDQKKGLNILFHFKSKPLCPPTCTIIGVKITLSVFFSPKHYISCNIHFVFQRKKYINLPEKNIYTPQHKLTFKLAVPILHNY